MTTREPLHLHRQAQHRSLFKIVQTLISQIRRLPAPLVSETKGTYLGRWHDHGQFPCFLSGAPNDGDCPRKPRQVVGEFALHILANVQPNLSAP